MKKTILIIVILAIVLVTGAFTQSKNATKNNDSPIQKSDNKIHSIDLSNEGLQKIPSYVFNEKNIEELNISNNNIEGSIQAEIRFLSELKSLDASKNLMTGIPAEIGQLKNLEYLNLSNNKLTGLPYELGNLTNLKVLDLSGNDYSSADLEIIKSKLPKDVSIITN